jgi:tetratricopeptide (TPR) repeat protein
MRNATLEIIDAAVLDRGGSVLEEVNRLAGHFEKLADRLVEAAGELRTQGRPPSRNFLAVLSNALRNFDALRTKVLALDSCALFASQNRPAAACSLEDLRRLLCRNSTSGERAVDRANLPYEPGVEKNGRTAGGRGNGSSWRLEEEAAGADSPETADHMASLAVVYHKQGKYADAEDLHRKALLIRERFFGCEHPKVASSLNNLALLYRDQGRIAEAQQLWERSLVIVERAFGPEHPKAGLRLSSLASLLYARGDYEKAEQYCQRLLVILRKKRTKASGERRSLREMLPSAQGEWWRPRGLVAQFRSLLL